MAALVVSLVGAWTPVGAEGPAQPGRMAAEVLSLERKADGAAGNGDEAALAAEPPRKRVRVQVPGAPPACICVCKCHTRAPPRRSW